MALRNRELHARNDDDDNNFFSSLVRSTSRSNAFYLISQTSSYPVTPSHSFLKTCLYHLHLFQRNVEIISSWPNLSLSTKLEVPVYLTYPTPCTTLPAQHFRSLQVQQSGTRYRTVSVNWRSAATLSDNSWRRICFVVTTQHMQRNTVICFVLPDK